MRTDDAVVVVTGASSGIGRATALELARRGADPVLVARRADALHDVARQCELAGARPLVVPADVTDETAVHAVVAQAQERLGPVDGWVNAASVMQFGALWEVPAADVARVLEVNVMGAVHGCQAVLPGMMARGRGVLVNVSSLLGAIALPFGGSYSMSKFALRALGAGLRQELRRAGATGVEVCTVLPVAVDTPIWQVAATLTGRNPLPPPPVLPPERVATEIVDRIRSPRREAVVGGVAARALLAAHSVVPSVAERLLDVVMDLMTPGSRTGPPGPGNLYEPAPGTGSVRGRPQE
ncbi:SDR family oxidoreductase [Pseudonocardia sp. KRD291]|uniref:SDR family NAD(P)-dependent oxidoreductase n=1 Tax=Pseudonocardia sp. KRD291 TaxID=2792007 RepID=UPI001C4A63FF|nr:SDR family NAD(P)-dependent oxidoreductase [Pseudonocardia sp. KRD291]MBW0103965.1 SDR family NAD(P)-dependent oxidoreductase [Pseudonocardia sp. KRD291]